MKPMIATLALTLPLGLAACMDERPAPLPGPATCNADRVQALVGREARPRVIDRAKARSGARTVRVIKPGMAVTMDFRSDRLNLDVDDVNTITAARCG
ncbi:I78 family peptidase inhibitor [Sphingomonas sp. ST-64]|uniref:I78 family peptidase inhibitor n=1 Tax=Sphingomonas plantiphila TaxID=3163295 RepID=A0ABW8YPD0_9SPHN